MCQDFGLQSPVSNSAAFIINAIIEQQEQQSEHEERPIFSVSKKPNSSEIKSWASDGALPSGLHVLHRPRRPSKNTQCASTDRKSSNYKSSVTEKFPCATW